MAEGKKLDLEEIKKSFPSLDGLSSKKLLGGYGGEHHNPWDSFHPTGHSNSGGSAHSGGGDSYFGDWDFGDDWGDDHGWGDDEQGGTDSNPDGSEGGNGQNSSGNPGNEQSSGELPNENIGSVTEFRIYELKNYSNERIAVKYGSYGTPIVWVYPGEMFSVPEGAEEIDGVNINGKTYKVTDGFRFIEIYNDVWITNYWLPGTYQWFLYNGGYQSTPPNPDWNELFYAVP